MAQARKKPVVNIVTWMHCYARYTAAMAAAHPTSTPGFMAHMLTVLKAYTEVEDPAWWVYDEAFREKMAATGCKTWGGMDVQLYQEVCAGKLRRKAPGVRSERGGASGRGGLRRSGGGGSGEQESAGSSDQQGHADSGMTAGSSMTGDRTMAPPQQSASHAERLRSTRNKPILNTEHD